MGILENSCPPGHLSCHSIGFGICNSCSIVLTVRSRQAAPLRPRLARVIRCRAPTHRHAAVLRLQRDEQIEFNGVAPINNREPIGCRRAAGPESARHPASWLPGDYHVVLAGRGEVDQSEVLLTWPRDAPWCLLLGGGVILSQLGMFLVGGR